MAEYHTVYEGPEGRTTQWEDIQIKLGNMAPKPKPFKPEKFEGEKEAIKDAEWLQQLAEEDLDGAEDDFQDDRALANLREQRLKELQEVAQRPLNGSLDFIRASDFRKEVTESSAQQWVIVTLYKDNIEECTCLLDCMSKLAAKYRRSKFIKMVSTDCIPDLPESKLPTVLVFHGGSCKKTFAGLSVWGGKRATEEYAALVLNELGPICQVANENQEEMVNRGVQELVHKMVLERQEGDEDSDFD